MTKKPSRDLREIETAFSEFCTTIAVLRNPQGGCPWDLKQDHQTLRQYMIEEAYEASAAMHEGKPKDICEELGDVLLQVVLNAQVATDAKAFTIVDVVRGINDKIIRRHPHVFGTDEERSKRGIDQIFKRWDEIKASEKNPEEAETNEKGVFEKGGAHKVYPATAQALKIGQIAKKIDFDWDTPEEVFRNLKSEIAELEAELESALPDRNKRMQAELGDVYFSLAQFCRHLNLDPETIAFDGNQKFLKRFRVLERLAQESRIDVLTASRDKLFSLWNQAKALD